jgi:hypothetical protein
MSQQFWEYHSYRKILNLGAEEAIAIGNSEKLLALVVHLTTIKENTNAFPSYVLQYKF